MMQMYLFLAYINHPNMKYWKIFWYLKWCFDIKLQELAIHDIWIFHVLAITIH